MATYLFYAFYVASKVGLAGLTPTVDVWGPGGAEVTAANATEIGDGLYSYSHTDAVDGDYTAVFKTADATVDAQHIPALAVKQISSYLDAAISSRAATGADSDTLETLSDQMDGAEPADVWLYPTRTLTVPVIAYTTYWYGHGFIAFMNKEIDWASDAIKVALLHDYVPDQDNHDYFDDVVAFECPAGGNYNAGGMLLPTPTVTLDPATNIITLDGGDCVWNLAIIHATHAVIYDSTPGLAATNPLIGYIDFGADMTSAGGDFRITWNTNGILSITAA